MSSNVLATHGNQRTMNLNSIIFQNIIDSPYLKTLQNLSNFQEIVNEAQRNGKFGLIYFVACDKNRQLLHNTLFLSFSLSLSFFLFCFVFAFCFILFYFILFYLFCFQLAFLLCL
ncbi:hypothetical protein BCR41DRAFT_22357 [Lobosporangium transversale]|uniref:Pre-mRNA-splicing factor 38 n=1 Tax=Lobosporangium transversale TaxID=64571 RepID=A0A1Y2GSV3_9FUNG|nr:hypothetical protein BCR41DRAFT_22357 [Lobosporangium transversale]ORZ21860.1 hypothetical protein BCR41DRAFT_22357 [Lobosporangium transversale]|eukprot:XP_021883111.1 hypothetical protein BCR41DRAFT_22357 [Lobosporangium transversale]